MNPVSPAEKHPVRTIERRANCHRRNFLRLGTGLFVVGALGQLTACSLQPPLKVAVQPWCGYQFLLLAQQEKYYESENMEIIATQATSESVSLLRQGRVDGAALTLDEVLRLREEGIPLMVVMVFDVSAGADVLLAKPEIARIDDLKGKRVGVEDSSLGKIMLAKLIEAGQLPRDSLTVKFIGVDHVQAWKEGGLDAILTYEPALSQLENQGLVRLLDSRSVPQTIFDVLAVRPDLNWRQQGSLRRLISGHFEQLAGWYSNPINTAYRLAPRLGVKPEQVRAVFKGLDLPDAIYNREYLSPPAQQLMHSASQIAEIMQRDAILRGPADLTQLFSADFLPEVTS